MAMSAASIMRAAGANTVPTRYGEPMSDDAAPPRLGQLSRLWLIAHWVIIVNFAVQIAYGGFMVFFVVRPEGVTGPLWEAATSMPHELMVTRRLYASETWLAIVGLALYVGITEILPRRLRRG